MPSLLQEFASDPVTARPQGRKFQLAEPAGMSLGTGASVRLAACRHLALCLRSEPGGVATLGAWRQVRGPVAPPAVGCHPCIEHLIENAPGLCRPPFPTVGLARRSASITRWRPTASAARTNLEGGPILPRSLSSGSTGPTPCPSGPYGREAATRLKLALLFERPRIGDHSRRCIAPEMDVPSPAATGPTNPRRSRETIHLFPLLRN